MEFLILGLIIVMSTIGLAALAKSTKEAPDIPLKIRVLSEIVTFCNKHELFPRTFRNVKYLCDKCGCSTQELEKALFILEEQQRIERVLEGFREYYRVLNNNITKVDLEFDLLDNIETDSLSSLILERTHEKINRDFNKDDNNWTTVSREHGRDSRGPTKLEIHYEANKKLVKLVKQGVTATGDAYIFYKFSRR
jgi:hypothetical protein